MTARLRPSLALVGWLILPGLALAGSDDKGKDNDASKNQRIEGVILKAEPVDSDKGPRVRLTINTAVVWRDYARDTSVNDTKEESTREAAKKGDKSVATEGQPRDPDALVTVVVSAETPALKRFRAEKDEASLGANSIESARKATGETKDSPSGGGPSVKPSELRKGLYVAVGYDRADKANQANWVVVLVPVRDDEAGR